MFCFFVLLLIVSPGGRLQAAGTEESAGGAARKDWLASTVVRADRRTGRLVRSVVVNPSSPAARKTPGGGTGKGRLTDGENRKEVERFVDEASKRHGVDPLLVHAMITVESNYNPYAISPKGAEGLMQLIPATARRMGVTNSFDRGQNIEGGVRYLRNLLDRFGEERLALAAYNAGEEAVARYNGIPPYAETQNYVYRVGKRWGELRRAGSKRQEALVSSNAPPAETYRPVEAYLDREGRLSLRTR